MGGWVGWMMAAIMGAAVAKAATVPPPRRIELNSYAQERIFLSTAPEVAVSGGWFSGKTFPGALLAYSYACEHPGAQVALCREERASMTMSTLRVLREEILPPQLATWNGSFGWEGSGSGVDLVW